MSKVIQAGLVAAIALPVVGAAAAQADHRRAPLITPGTSYYEKSTFSRYPEHGYSGSPLNGVTTFGLLGHCDYHRLPVRECNGYGRCKVVAWELKQFCY